MITGVAAHWRDPVEMKVEVIEKDGYRRYDKWYGRSFNDNNVRQGFETFLAGAKAGTIDRSTMVARRVADELKNVQEVLESEESRMYSASILVVYEGDPDVFERSLDEEKKISDREGQEESDEDDDDFEIEFTEEPMELQLPDGKSQQVININIDPQYAPISEMPDLGDDDEDDTPKVHDLRVIDFAHGKWTPGEGPDENMLMGIKSLVKMFEELAC